MRRGDLDDLVAFSVVAEQGSFTRAAAKLNMSQSALSHAIRALEERLGIRLLARTTRSVATTEAGEELLKTLRSAFSDIDESLSVLRGKRETPSGTVRLTMVRQAALTVIEPMLDRFLKDYPDIRLEIDLNDSFTDIVRNRFDAGIRFGEHLEKDMIAMRVGPDIRAAVVASPSYLALHAEPSTPRDLGVHRCINYRLASTGGMYAWEFAKNGQQIEVRVDGPLVFNDGELIRMAALNGHGVAYLFEDQVQADLSAGRLVRLLETWCPSTSGYYIYYPGRRQLPAALAAFITAVRSQYASSLAHA